MINFGGADRPTVADMAVSICIDSYVFKSQPDLNS